MKTLIALSLAILASNAAAEEGAPASPTASLRIEVTDVRNGNGALACVVFAKAEGFPSRPELAVARGSQEASPGLAVFTFEGLAPGAYAVSVIHDENGNGKLDKNLVGAPTEGWATSNNVTHAFHGPSFEESKLVLQAGPNVAKLTLHY